MPTRRVLIASTLLMCGLSFALAQQQTLVIPDNLFTQAGFVVKYATTPEKSRASEIASAGQAREANEGWQDILRLCGC